jgi:hypothetical protein
VNLKPPYPYIPLEAGLHYVQRIMANCSYHALPKLLKDKIFLHYSWDGLSYPEKTLKGLFSLMIMLVRKKELPAIPLSAARWPLAYGE